MSIRDQFRQHLQAAGSGPVSIDIQDGDERLVCELSELDRFG